MVEAKDKGLAVLEQLLPGGQQRELAQRFLGKIPGEGIHLVNAVCDRQGNFERFLIVVYFGQFLQEVSERVERAYTEVCPTQETQDLLPKPLVRDMKQWFEDQGNPESSLYSKTRPSSINILHVPFPLEKSHN